MFHERQHGCIRRRGRETRGQPHAALARKTSAQRVFRTVAHPLHVLHHRTSFHLPRRVGRRDGRGDRGVHQAKIKTRAERFPAPRLNYKTLAQSVRRARVRLLKVRVVLGDTCSEFASDSETLARRVRRARRRSLGGYVVLGECKIADVL